MLIYTLNHSLDSLETTTSFAYAKVSTMKSFITIPLFYILKYDVMKIMYKLNKELSLTSATTLKHL